MTAVDRARDRRSARAGRDTRPTVAYVGNFAHSFCTERHIELALGSLGFRTLRLQESRTNWGHVRRQVTRARARALLWTRTWDVNRNAARQALAHLRDDGVPTVSFHLDRWWGLDREYQIATEPFFRTDVVFTADGGDHDWAAAGVNHRWLPPGVSASDCVPARPDPSAWPQAVVFVGSYPYPHAAWAPYREQVIVTARRAAGSHGFEVLPGRDPDGRPRPAVREGRLRSLYATARIVVGDSCLAGGAVRYWSDRIPETLGRGGFLIHPEVEGLDDWYRNGVHLVTYPLGDFDALGDLIAYWLRPAQDDERRAIAAAGRELVLGRDTYTHRMSTVLEEIGLL